MYSDVMDAALKIKEGLLRKFHFKIQFLKSEMYP